MLPDGYLVCWAGLAYKIINVSAKHRYLVFVQQNFKEQTVCKLSCELHSSYFQAGLMVCHSQENKYVLVDMANQKAYFTQNKCLQREALHKILVPTRFGLSLPNRIVV